MSDETGQTEITEPQNEKNFGGRPKSFIWETHIIQGKKVLNGHYEANCRYCNKFWHKGSSQVLEAHLANNCIKVPLEIRQLFINRLAAKANSFTNNQTSNKKHKPNK